MLANVALGGGNALRQANRTLPSFNSRQSGCGCALMSPRSSASEQAVDVVQLKSLDQFGVRDVDANSGPRGFAARKRESFLTPANSETDRGSPVILSQQPVTSGWLAGRAFFRKGYEAPMDEGDERSVVMLGPPRSISGCHCGLGAAHLTRKSFRFGVGWNG